MTENDPVASPELAGVRTMLMSNQTLRFPKTLKDPAGEWKAENASIVEGEPTSGTQALERRNAKAEAPTHE